MDDKNKTINWKPLSEYNGGRVLATNDLDILIGEINSDGDCISDDDSTLLCGITAFADIDDIIPKPKESEDERIRKAISQCVEDMRGQFEKLYSVHHKDALAWLEKQGEKKPADNIKPRFKVGDWILYSGDNYEGVRYITKIDENGYYVERNGLPHGIIPFNHEICMRLWTIQDAKDGDVLVDRYNNIGIFLQYLCIHWYSQIYLDCNGELRGFCLGGSHEPIGTHPATKEQRDILFKKMKEKGFEWDAEKKWVKMFG